MAQRSTPYLWPAVYLALSLAGVALCWYARHVLLLTFAGILLAILLHSGGTWVNQRLGISYGWGLTIFILVLLTAGTAGVVFFGAGIANQVAGLWQSLPQSFENARQQLRATEWGSSILKNTPTFDEIAKSSAVWSHLGGAATAAANALFAGILILFVGIYGAISPQIYVNGIVRLVPPQHRDRARQTLRELGDALRWWIMGHLLTMTIVGVLIGIGLSLLGVPQPVALALVAFLLELVPNFGPVVAAIPALLLAWTVETQLVLYVAMLYFGVQLIESYLVLPLIQRQATSLPPALTIVAVVLFGLIGGLPGVVVATPLMLTIYFLTKKLYVEGTLEGNSLSG